MNKLKKYQFLTLLELFEKKKCKTIDDIRKLIEKEVKDDDGVVFSWKEYK